MKRRTFCKYTSLGTASFLVTACGQGNLGDPFGEGSKSAVDFGKLEKTYLTLGFVPGTDAAPLIIAKEKGFFTKYGLTVALSRKKDWAEIEKGLLEYRLDAAQTLYAMPLLAQLGKQYAPLISLMVLNLNGSAIALTQQAWKEDVRSLKAYINFQDFAANFRDYIRHFAQAPSFAVESQASIDYYLYRYWLAAMGINPDNEVELTEIAPSQLIYKLQAGAIEGYCASEPWNQQAVLNKAGFIVCVNRDIWQGHPGKILATMKPWIDNYPTTARALVAALLEACQYCDRPENRPEVAQILAKSQYLNTKLDVIAPSLVGKYPYSRLGEKPQISTLPDFNLFYFQKTNYLQPPNHANYPWRSHAVWLLTQMIRWNQIDHHDYPKDADNLLDKAYPVEIYEEVARTLSISLPNDRLKKEPASAFIDRREFDPSQPVAYLNQFGLRATSKQRFVLG
jgi:nitrate/nitrite transport system substrate-binding protein